MYSEITVHNYCLSIPATANGMIRATQKFPTIRYVVISTLSALTKTTICMNSALLTISSLTVSLVSDQDSQLKQLYYQLSILGFLYWITKMQSVQFSLISLKHLTLSHKPLLDSLSLLDPPLLLVWLHSYLQGRTQQVIIALSSKSEVTSGVPQGSIILFINIS